MIRNIHIDDTGAYRGLEIGDKVEFVTTEMDGVWGYGEVTHVIDDILYVIGVEGQVDIYRLLKDSGRFTITGDPTGKFWFVELDGTGFSNVFARK